MKTQIKTASWEKYRNDLAEELKKDGLRAAVEKRCDEIEEETRGANYARGYITELLNEILDLVKIAEEDLSVSGRIRDFIAESEDKE